MLDCSESFCVHHIVLGIHTHHPKDGFVSQLHPLRFLHECDSSYGALTSTPVGLTPTEQTSLSWTHCFPKTHIRLNQAQRY